MPRAKSCYTCSVCGSAGGIIVRRAARDNVYLPPFLEIDPDGTEGFRIVNNIKTIPEAMDFVAKIFLRVEEYFIRHPPSGGVDDEFADLVYAELASSYGDIHTKDEIKRFEVRHINNSTSRTSVAFRYGAILFTALSSMWRQIDFSQPIPPAVEDRMAFTICSIFYNELSQFVDERIKIPFFLWPEILSTATDTSYRHAASKFGTQTESGKRSLSAKYIKNRRYEMLIRCFYYQCFEPGEKYYRYFISLLAGMKSDSDIKCFLMFEFDKQEKESKSRSFHRHSYYYLQHHLPDGKKKACRLDNGGGDNDGDDNNDIIIYDRLLQVKNTDEIYSESIHELIGICLFAHLAKSDGTDFKDNSVAMKLAQHFGQKMKLLVNKCHERLLELNYPSDFAIRKIASDVLCPD